MLFLKELKKLKHTVMAMCLFTLSCTTATKAPMIENPEWSPAWPHSEIQKFEDGLYFVQGTNKITHNGKNIQTSRTMTVLAHDGELALINTVRLNEEGLQHLDSLGKVKHIIRLGAFHGRDDRFYQDRYHAKLWTIDGMELSHGEKPNVQYLNEQPFDFSDSILFHFQSTQEPEGYLWINRNGGILITCDSVKNALHPNSFFNEETKKDFQKQGLFGEAKIDSVWTGVMTPKKEDLRRLLKHPFHILITAHGEPLTEKAFEKLKASIEGFQEK